MANPDRFDLAALHVTLIHFPIPKLPMSRIKAMTAVHFLDVTQEDIDGLLEEAGRARDNGQPSVYYQGRRIQLTDIFEGAAYPIVQAIKQLHLIRQDDHRHGNYRDSKL